jgi:regulatory protein
MISASMRSKSKPLFDEESLYAYAVCALASHMQSVAEIKRKLRRRASGDSAELLVEVVIARLKQNNYLNDESYAATYTSYRRDNQKLGKLRVISDLKAKGVSAEVIREAVDTAFDATTDEQQAREFLQRKRVAEPKDDRAAARIFRLLMRAGFAKRSIISILKKWNVDDETLTALETEEEEETNKN